MPLALAPAPVGQPAKPGDRERRDEDQDRESIERRAGRGPRGVVDEHRGGLGADVCGEVSHDDEVVEGIGEHEDRADENRQVGSPSEIYELPATACVANFLGSANVLEVEVIGRGGDGRTAFRLAGATLEASGDSTNTRRGTLVVRPERIVVEAVATGSTISGIVQPITYLGARSDVEVLLGSGQALTLRGRVRRLSCMCAGRRSGCNCRQMRCGSCQRARHVEIRLRGGDSRGAKLG